MQCISVILWEMKACSDEKGEETGFVPDFSSFLVTDISFTIPLEKSLLIDQDVNFII